MFLTKGYQEDVSNVVNNAFFFEHAHEMVVIKNIEIHSLCEHHPLPFVGKVTHPILLALLHYLRSSQLELDAHRLIPSSTVIGLSKLPRLAEIFSRRLQI
jgi:GTP cyclohydrolase I